MKLEVGRLKPEISRFRLEASAEDLDLKAEGIQFVSPIKAEVEITPSGDSFLVWVKIKANARMECARCLLGFSAPIEAQFNMFIEKEKPGLEVDPESEDTIVITPQSKFIDISDRVKQAIALSLPFKPLCSPDCRGLCHICGADLNASPCNCVTEEYDGRWDKLKHLLNKEEE